MECDTPRRVGVNEMAVQQLGEIDADLDSVDGVDQAGRDQLRRDAVHSVLSDDEVEANIVQRAAVVPEKAVPIF